MVAVASGGKTLFAKLAKISGEIGTVAKKGRNEHHGYNYVTEADLLAEVRAKLAAAGVAYFFSVESVSTREVHGAAQHKDGHFVFYPAKAGHITEVIVSATFADSETGETYTVTGAGAGQDAGDKGVYKALTGAQKYLLMKTFLIATGDDPEGDSKVDKANAGEEKPSKAKTAATPTTKINEALKVVAAEVAAQVHGQMKTAEGGDVDDDMNKILPGGPYKGTAIGALTLAQTTELLEGAKPMPASNSWTPKVRKRHDYLKAFATMPPEVQEAAKQLDLETVK